MAKINFGGVEEQVVRNVKGQAFRVQCGVSEYRRLVRPISFEADNAAGRGLGEEELPRRVAGTVLRRNKAGHDDCLAVCGQVDTG